VRAALIAAVVMALGCSHQAPNATPEGAVRLWLERMEGSVHNLGEVKDAYALLGPRARDNLEKRAERASQVEGRRAEPYEMLAAGRFGLRFRPKAMHATVNGDDAIVDVTGDDPETERGKVVCVREDGLWHVEPDLPPVAPPQRRPDPSATP
jgi:hypothetical protein